MDLYEVTLRQGFGGPYYVDAESIDDAKRKGLARHRYNCTALDFWPAEFVVTDVKLCDKKAVQYA